MLVGDSESEHALNVEAKTTTNTIPTIDTLVML